MAQRYVRVKTITGQTYYGRLQLNRTVEVLDAPPWLNGKVTDLILQESDYRLLPPVLPLKLWLWAKTILLMRQKWVQIYQKNL